MENTYENGQTEIETGSLDGQSNLAVSYFGIYGLNCLRCGERVKTALSQVPGVANVIIAFPQGIAEVTYDSKNVTVDGLVQAVEAAGDGGHHSYQAQWLE